MLYKKEGFQEVHNKYQKTDVIYYFLSTKIERFINTSLFIIEIMTLYIAKYGTKALMKDSKCELDTTKLENIARVHSDLREKGIYSVIVTSGGMLAAMKYKKLLESMGIKDLNKLPINVEDKQKLAEHGWPDLILAWRSAFEPYDLGVPGEFLYTHNNFANRYERKNIKKKIEDCFDRGEVPVINTNDNQTDEELVAKYNSTFGDNDRLYCLLAMCLNVDRSFLFTDVDGIYTKNPVKEDAERIKEIYPRDRRMIRKQLEKESRNEKGGILGRGGILSKFDNACYSNIDTVVGNINKMEEIVNEDDLKRISKIATVIYRKPSFFEKIKKAYEKTPRINLLGRW